MSEIKHTAAPWEATNRLNSIGKAMKGGRFVILQRGASKREDFFIAEMPFAAVRSGDARECEANARLIAASPDMLEALEISEKHLVELYRSINLHANDGAGNRAADADEAVIAIRAAIAKATGGVP